MKEKKNTDRKIIRATLLSFAALFFGMIIATVGWFWLRRQPSDKGVFKPLRKGLDLNEKINTVFYSNKHQSKEYLKKDAVKNVRVNGDLGMGEEFDPENWTLKINKPSKNVTPLFFELNMAEIKALPKRDVIFNFKCIEGWSQITHWGGVRFSDFLAKYHLGTKSGKLPDPKHPEDLYKYVGLITPDSAYYVGIDMKSMLHPQTILCYELNEKELPMDQGFPLRLIITVKYGIKSLKRIGYIYFSDTRPPDYWFERGYDYDSAL